jgi:hypothetical protein
MDNKKIILLSLLFVVALLVFLFVMEKLSLKGIDSNSQIGGDSIDISGRSEIKGDVQNGSKPLDTILKSD